MTRTEPSQSWGQPPWKIHFEPQVRPLPQEVDFAIAGGGFTGLAAAAWLRRIAPEKTVAVLEAGRIGAGASGRTGGIAIGETAAGDLPGLGDVLAGFPEILQTLEVDCDMRLSGAWEIGRSGERKNSPIEWQDFGSVRVVDKVPGGIVDPGKMVSGLARAAERLGAIVIENAPVSSVTGKGKGLAFDVGGRPLRTRQAIFATNAQALEITGLAGHAQPKITLAVATEPLQEDQLEAIGLAGRNPFYTIDLPYLWGRVMTDGGVVWGGGLVHVDNWLELAKVDVTTGEAAALLDRLEQRVRGLHPALRDVKFTHRWGGPILFAPSYRPVFARHPHWTQALVIGAYAGHGVALSVYFGRWAAEVLLGRRELPAWGAIGR
jgi:glycine/D-amino acid oxidase-like deaminating enzyme